MRTPPKEPATTFPTYREQIGKRCRHYNGLFKKTCDLGISYDSVADETRSGMDRFPCFKQADQVTTCESRSFPTEVEIDEQEREFNESFGRTMQARAAIVEATQGKRSVRGRIKCPVCDGGTLGFSVASNGHIHAQCSTPKCCSWME